MSELAVAFRVKEERIFHLCERFRARGVLEVERAVAGVPPATAATAAPPSGQELPHVSVIIPTLDRAAELDECLRALRRLDYPKERLEILVVDDGSADNAAVAVVAARHGARLLVNDRNRGPAYSRNRGADVATGEILAFVDSDCVAPPSWLKELVPYFAWERVGAVGGRTVAYFTDSPLDRYEEVSSPLDMGPWLHIAGPGPDTFYVPTCNLLVRRSLYERLGGLREDLRVGEDVDLCWRLREQGYYLVYAPEGVVKHKHRERLAAMLGQRFRYGTSEAVLHRLHPEKHKRFPLLGAPLATVVLAGAAMLALEPRLLPPVFTPLLWDGVKRCEHLRREGARVTPVQVWGAAARVHLGMLYATCFHLQRYYLWPLALLGLRARGAWVLGAFSVLYSAAVDYAAKRPRVDFPTFLAFYAAEHLAYQSGVIAGCVRTGSLRSYLPVLTSSPKLS